MDNEQTLVEQAAALTKALSRCPRQKLGPFVMQLEQLSSEYSRLAQLTSESTSINEVSATRYMTPESPHLSRREMQVVRLLSAAKALVPGVERAVFSHRQPMGLSREQLRRDTHIQTILSAQRRRLSTEVGGQERLMLLCACLSLAKEFGEFERRAGWTPKSEQLAARITSGQGAGVQTIGKHVGNYVASLASSGYLKSERCKLDAALRLGIKLEVLDTVSAANGMSSGLSLLMGFECAQFSRLSYDSFGELRKAIEDDCKVDGQLVHFTNLTGEWWAGCLESYHQQFKREGM